MSCRALRVELETGCSTRFRKAREDHESCASGIVRDDGGYCVVQREWVCGAAGIATRCSRFAPRGGRRLAANCRANINGRCARCRPFARVVGRHASFAAD